ncbi:MAG: biotin/lipoyl-containing protein, partial [Candidatus Cybelea sp.]
MSSTIEVRVPDIGDFKDVPVIEVLVKPGDRVKKNDSLITLESEKASMEVPAEADGVVQDVRVKVGDKVSQGMPIVVLATSTDAPATAPAAAPAAPSPAQAIEVRVPDIGDFKDVPVIEVLVKPGDRVKKNDSLITLESEKASMEVPAEADGVVQDVKVKVGDKVSEGMAIVVLATDSAASPAPPAPAKPSPAAISVPVPVAAAAPPAPIGNGMVHAGPSIRRFARELGVDLQKLRGTGPNGRITREDVQGFVKSALQSSGGGSGAAPF